ncbi:hypothetical protein [Pseudomonas petrae]|uniref:Uncharacterized protein n=1 Tax=Pseudomonas petrae TaxID=2912190 RepID=A0ABS9I520_9PSED|nr:hypothetical protein [Pseudomonas petrae]MCF7533787.1 hypothetical protein [Pseudomonas petrae]MCF7538334.1 hypothetical protein [Pseudomonas petrae]MCF7542254.1 hypothetical protein [Pseudomonas petrae]MCF7555699.1 hypothetical protein [Pseudomonas petrae]
MIPDEIIEQVTTDSINGVLRLISYVRDQITDQPDYSEREHEVSLEAFALVSSLHEADMIHTDVFEPELDGNMQDACMKIWQYLKLVETQLSAQASGRRLQSLKEKFTVAITNGFAYEFTEGDIKRVQELINELRDELTKESRLDENHKRRLMRRLEALQKELHKKVSDLDNFYGLLGAFGVAAGKLGTDAKPLVDRVKEIVGIAWKSEARAEQLSSSAENPLLGSDAEPPALS